MSKITRTKAYDKIVKDGLDCLKEDFEKSLDDLEYKLQEEKWADDIYGFLTEKTEPGGVKIGDPYFCFLVYNDDGDVFLEVEITIDEFLDKSLEKYAIWWDCWGYHYIDSLEFLKSKIQERIDRTKESIKAEGGMSYDEYKQSEKDGNED